MSERDELAALRRLAELEAKAQSAAAAEDAKPRMLSDPTADSGAFARFMMGMGTAGTELSQGFRQLFNIGDQKKLAEEIARSRQIDAPFKQGVAGVTGNVLGKAAPAVAAGLIPGAGTVLGGAMVGAGTGLLEPSATDAEAAKNVMFGGLGGGAATLVGRALPAVAGGLVAPFTGRGREGIVGQSLQRFAGDKADDVAKAARAASAKTPGWQPTLAEATMDPRMAILQRGAASADATLAGELTERALEQNAAAVNVVRNMAGTSAQRAVLEESRRNATAPLYEAAMESGINQEAARMLRPQIKDLMARPSMQSAAVRAKEIFGEESIKLAKEGDVKGLQYMKQALDDMVEKASSPASAIGKNQLRALEQTRGDLKAVLDDLVPQLRQADQIYAHMSLPVNQSRIAAELEKRLTPALMDGMKDVTPKLHADRYASALRSLDEQLPKMTGYPGATLEGSISARAMNELTGIRDDLARRSMTSELGRGVGSNTAQNLASQNLLRNIFGPMGMPESFIESTLAKTIAGPANMAFRQGAEPEIQKLMARAMLDPKFAAELLARQYGPGLIGRTSNRLLPAIGTAGGLLGVQTE